jgi:3-dehydrosphinganine reductase
MSFSHKHALITGGSSGIGKALALQLAQAGAHITLIARSQAKLNQAKAEITQAQATATQKMLAITADVADRTQVSAAVEQAIAQTAPPDLLITAAGIAHPGYFQELSLDIFERTMAVNYFGSLYALKAVHPWMAQRHQGHVVLISSGVGLMGIFGYSAYSPSKFALRGLAESLRGELKPQGICLSIVYPPDTDTPQLTQENLTKPPETKAIAATAQVWSAADVARVILQGIQKQQFAITPGLEMGVLARLHSLLGPSLNWYFDRLVAQTPTQKRR